MKLLMLNNEYPPLGGGTGTVTQELALRLTEKHAIEIDLVTSAVGRSRDFEAVNPMLRIFKVPVSNACLHHSSNVELLRYTFWAIRDCLWLTKEHRYDGIFAWSTVPSGFVARILAARAKIPYFVRVSGPDIPGFEERYARLYPVLAPLLRHIWRRAERVIVKCDHEQDLVARADPALDSKRIAMIPNGVDSERFTPVALRTGSANLRVLCVGRLIRRKGQDTLLWALARLRKKGLFPTLTLVGTGDEEAEYQRLAEELGLADCVRFLGYVPREEMPGVYAEADIFVLPSQNEGMSIALLEAMACGLPVIATAGSGSEELVTEGENGFLFPWQDAEALAAQMSKFVETPGLVARMGQASRVRAAGFSWDAVVLRYVDMFRLQLRTL